MKSVIFAILASMVWGTAPVLFLILGESFSWLRAFGILLVVCGIVLLSLSSGK